MQVVIDAGDEAATAGVLIGGRLGSLNGKRLQDRAELVRLLRTLKDGTTVVVGWVRPARLVRLIYAKRHVMDSSIDMRCLIRCVHAQPRLRAADDAPLLLLLVVVVVVLVLVVVVVVLLLLTAALRRQGAVRGQRAADAHGHHSPHRYPQPATSSMLRKR